MTDPFGQRLSLAEWMVLCLVREEPTYGLVLVGLLARDGSLGQVWSVPKAVVYRSLQRLEQLGLIRTVGEQRTSQGPVRSLYEATPAGQAAAWAWLSTPVEHARDVRSELMVKLALLDRSGVDSRDLLQAQLARLLPVAAALDDRLRATTGFEHTLVLWRHEAMTATMRFLESLTARHGVGSGLFFFGEDDLFFFGEDDASCSPGVAPGAGRRRPAGQAAAAACGDGGPDRGCAHSAGAVGASGSRGGQRPGGQDHVAWL
jgi:DNA-binding PadR family transcriptional regulator